MKCQQRDRMYIKEPKRNSGAEKYKNWIENLLEGLNNRFKQVEESISKLEDETFEIIAFQEQKEK